MKASQITAVVVIVIVLVLLFLFAPVVSYTFTSSNFGVGTYTITAQVSPSFYVVGCGLVWNPTKSVSAFGSSASQQIYSGGEWKCK